MRKLCLVLIAGALLIAAAAPAAAEAPPGPRLGVVRIAPGSLFANQLITEGPLGEQPEPVLAPKRQKDLAPQQFAWAPDGATLAVTANRHAISTVGGRLYVVNADGSGLRRLGTMHNAAFPVISPDGRTIYFDRLKENLRAIKKLLKHPGQLKDVAITAFFPKTSIWAINTDGTGLRRLTPTRRYPLVGPSSVSPATGQIAVSRSRCKNAKCSSSTWLLDPATGIETPLADGAVQAIFSPDGHRIAFLGYGGGDVPLTGPHRLLAPPKLYVRDLSTGTTARVTHTPRARESSPSWDPSGQRLAYVRSGGKGDRIYEVNPDGSCPTNVTAHHEIPLILSVAWQPGTGREAGPLSC
jgi:Tol biopolymer transport system component